MEKRFFRNKKIFHWNFLTKLAGAVSGDPCEFSTQFGKIAIYGSDILYTRACTVQTTRTGTEPSRSSRSNFFGTEPFLSTRAVWVASSTRAVWVALATRAVWVVFSDSSGLSRFFFDSSGWHLEKMKEKCAFCACNLVYLHNLCLIMTF